MVKILKFSNLKIFNIASNLMEAFKEENDFPVKINFFLQKNMTQIIDCAQEIEESRMEIINKFGKPSKDDPEQFTIPLDKVEEAQNELNDLFSLEQEISINMLDLDWFDNVQMNSRQVSAISFMIDYEEEEENVVTGEFEIEE